ncbi:Uncharacterized protein HA466_0096400 [Hirschfeldia incana]|nr:Uncharacterized protein HA466_0096400 [Hirschfeldia incana]
MAEADPDSSDTSDLKHISSAPLFSIPRFFIAKDSDASAGRSPTSPLDFSLFGGLFSPRSPPAAAAAPSSPIFRNRWACDKVGLSLLSSSAGEEGHEDDLFRRENIVLAPQIKPRLFGPSCVKSNSLPKNYTTPSSMSSDVVNIHPLPCDSVTGVVEEHDSPRRSSSSPMDIISSQAYSRSLSAREMALSEDYTCIISHGPNPKTTHIFGDCILDCDPNELGNKDDETEKLCLCTDKAQNHIHMDSETSAAAAAAAAADEKESDKGGVEDCLEISPGSSYNEDLFPMAS